MTGDSLFPDYDAEAFIPSGDGETVIPDDARFVVDSTAKAEWAMQRLAAAMGEIAARRAEADEMAGRVERWLDRVTRSPASTADYMRALLVDYHQRLWAAAVEAGVVERDLPRSVPLPSGDLSSRAPGKGALVVDDEDGLLAWLAENDGPVTEVSRRVIVKSLLRERCAEVDKDGATVLVLDGQVVPHVHVERTGERSWSVTPHE